MILPLLPGKVAPAVGITPPSTTTTAAAKAIRLMIATPIDHSPSERMMIIEQYLRGQVGSAHVVRKWIGGGRGADQSGLELASSTFPRKQSASDRQRFAWRGPVGIAGRGAYLCLWMRTPISHQVVPTPWRMPFGQAGASIDAPRTLTLGW